MDNLAINDNPQALATYSRHQIDRTYADQYESVLGHLICERGKSVKAALEDLRPIVSQTRRETLSAVDWCQKLGFGGIGVGVLVGAGMGMGFAILPILAGTISIKFWADSRSEMPRRDAEYHLLKTTPNLPEALYALHLRGVTAVKIVGAYDQLVAAIEARLESDGEFTEAEVGEFLQVKVSGDMGLEITVPTASHSETQAPTELQEAIAPGVAAAPSMVHSKILCPIEVLGRDPYQSMGLIGGQRTGKTWLAALHTQNVKRKRGTKIIYINLMDAIGDAADDWSHADICITCHLRKLAPHEAKKMIEHVISVVNGFFNELNQILVFDEWVGFTSTANQWPKKASQEAAAAAIESKEAKVYIEPEGLGTSAIELMNLVMAVVGELNQSGKKQLKSVWLLSPMVKAGGMESQGLIIKQVQPLAVAISKDESVSWTHPVTGEIQEIGFDDAGYRASIPNMGLPPIESIPKMDCLRMLYAKGTWYSLDNLPKLEQMPAARSPSPFVDPGSIARWQNLDAMHHERMMNALEPEEKVEQLERLWNIPSVEVEIETSAIDERPEGLGNFPLVLTIWEYLDGKDARTMKQISGAMKTGGKISDDILTAKVGQFETYKDAIKTVVNFGVSKGYLKQVSEDAYEAIRKH